MRPEQNQKSGGPLISSKFILIGEDDKDDEEFIKEIFHLVDESFSLVFFNNGKRVVTHIESLQAKNQPCLILLDYNMPEMTGCEILEELKMRKLSESVPKVIWSTSASETYKKQCLEAGADDYIIKPSNVSDLMEIAKYLFAKC